MLPSAEALQSRTGTVQAGNSDCVAVGHFIVSDNKQISGMLTEFSSNTAQLHVSAFFKAVVLLCCIKVIVSHLF